MEVLQERTHKYGRNVTAAAVVIMVLALVQDIDLGNSKPLGLAFTEGPRGELAIWWLLTGVLVYYFVRFSVSLTIDYLANKHHIRGYFESSRGFKKTLREALARGDDKKIENTESKISGMRSDCVQVWQFFILEAGLPIVLFLAAAYAAYGEIRALWC